MLLSDVVHMSHWDLLRKKSMTPPVRQTVLGKGLHSTSPKLLPRTTQQCPAHLQTSLSSAYPSSPSPSGFGNFCSNLSNSSLGQSINFMTCCFRTTSIDSCPVACVLCMQANRQLIQPISVLGGLPTSL